MTSTTTSSLWRVTDARTGEDAGTYEAVDAEAAIRACIEEVGQEDCASDDPDDYRADRLTTFALLDDACVVECIYEHTDAERDQHTARYGRRYVYLPQGGEVGDQVRVDESGEAIVIPH